MFFLPLRTLRCTLLICAGASIFLATLSDAGAQPRKIRRYYTRHSTVVLQPFSLEKRSRLGLAYHSSRPAPILRSTDDETDDSVSARKIESGGSHPTVSGKRAVLRNGIAYAPSNAPDSVKSAIWAANQIRHKPYVWGGGHGSFSDSGYDCSGTV